MYSHDYSCDTDISYMYKLLCHMFKPQRLFLIIPLLSFQVRSFTVEQSSHLMGRKYHITLFCVTKMITTNCIHHVVVRGDVKIPKLWSPTCHYSWQQVVTEKSVTSDTLIVVSHHSWAAKSG